MCFDTDTEYYKTSLGSQIGNLKMIKNEACYAVFVQQMLHILMLTTETWVHGEFWHKL